jgi:hypothetical protein
MESLLKRAIQPVWMCQLCLRTPVSDLSGTNTRPGNPSSSKRCCEYCWMPGSSPGMTSLCLCRHLVARHTSTFSPRNAPELVHETFRPMKAWRYPKGERGMPGARCTRSRACSGRSTRVSHHGRTGITRHSRTRMVLTVSFVLSPAIGLCCHRHLAEVFFRDA